MRHFAPTLLFCLTTAVAAPFLAGCASHSPPAAPTSATPAMVIGEVVILDEEKRFVLVDLGSRLYVPAPGTSLRTRNATGETGRLRAAPEQKRPFVAADIVDGAPAVGDEVVQ